MDAAAHPIRPDFERIRAARREARGADRLRAHYAVESALARELSAAPAETRAGLYASVYRRLFESVSDHPQHSAGGERRAARIVGQVAMLRTTLGPDSVYVEIGCGDALLTRAMALHVRRAIGIDVTGELIGDERPPNFEFVLTDGITLDLPDGCADLVYSNQLMEHLHVDDAMVQLREIHRVLKPGGRYVCATPNRLTGPHDISVYFGTEPAGLHMREYDHRMLAGVFREVGFSAVRAAASIKGRMLTMPIWLASVAETVFDKVPRNFRQRLALIGPVVNLAGVNLIGVK